jgi:PhzF family phenazine biosynthesis protein
VPESYIVPSSRKINYFAIILSISGECMKATVFHVNTFTNKIFHGNPASVVILSEPKNSDWMLQFAQETNQPVTSYVKSNGNHFDLRWFYSEKEALLCGHGTVAAAHILWEQGFISRNKKITFRYSNGENEVNSDGDWIYISLPFLNPSVCDNIENLEEMIGAEINYVRKSELDYLIEVKSEIDLKNLSPNFLKLAILDCRGIIVTAQSKEFDFVSRFFCPRSINKEDQVTGSAHTTLFPYWRDKLQKNCLEAFQCSQRGGHLKLTEFDKKVQIGGQAITITSGQIITS